MGGTDRIRRVQRSGGPQVLPYYSATDSTMLAFTLNFRRETRAGNRPPTLFTRLIAHSTLPCSSLFFFCLFLFLFFSRGFFSCLCLVSETYGRPDLVRRLIRKRTTVSGMVLRLCLCERSVDFESGHFLSVISAWITIVERFCCNLFNWVEN